MTYNDFASAIIFQPTALEDTKNAQPHLSLARPALLFFGFFSKNRSAKRTRRPNATPAHTDSQLNPDRFRLRKQYLGRAQSRRQRTTAEEFRIVLAAAAEPAAAVGALGSCGHLTHCRNLRGCTRWPGRPRVVRRAALT